jgi:ribulose-phosphate 3-epimerase
MSIKIAPSILSADFSCLRDEIRKVENAGADMLHIDVMDGHFVPNITIGAVVVRYIRQVSRIPLDVHLMIEHPQKFIDDFADAGSDMVTVHIETISAAAFRQEVLALKKRGIKAGIALNPATPLKKIKPVLRIADFVLVMSVEPGFSGQRFIPAVIPKIRKLRAIFAGDIAVDGGINVNNAKLVIAAGASILAAGSAIFGAPDIKGTIRRMKKGLLWKK